MVAYSRLLREPATVHRILFVGALAAALVLASLVSRNSSYATGSAYVRVNQVGYISGETKRAILMATGSESGATFNVLNTANGHSVYRAPIGASQGSWSSAFPDTYLLDLTPVQTRGSYTIQVDGPIAATSPTFKIDTGANLYSALLPNALFFYLAQRDGPDVNLAVMNRRPTHLTDQQASIYSTPIY